MIDRRASLVGAIAALAGCYRVDQSENGHAYRVNTITGEVDEIVGDRLIRARTPDEIEEDRANRDPTEALLSARRDWPVYTIPVDGGTNIEFATKFDDVSMQYIIYANKNWKKPDRILASITIQLQDADGFEIARDLVPLSDMTSILGENSNDVIGLHYRGRVVMTADQYRSIDSYTVSWAGF